MSSFDDSITHLNNTTTPQHSPKKLRSGEYNIKDDLIIINNERNPSGFTESATPKSVFCRASDNDPWIYENQAIMAPMVRVSTLPSRLTARDYGCRMTYSEEIVAKKLIRCSRFTTSDGLIGFVEEDKNNSKSNAKTLVTYPGERLALQLGVSNGIDAVAAANIVGNDVRSIDINMGCPKLFSLQGAMGAALLTEPEIVKDIISSLKRNSNLPITCKIRMLANPRHTVELIKMVEQLGVEAIGVHARYKEDRPRHRALPLEQMNLLSSSVSVPLLYNGDVFVTDDIDRYRALTGCSSVLIARGAMWNYSIFNYNYQTLTKEYYQSHDASGGDGVEELCKVEYLGLSPLDTLRNHSKDVYKTGIVDETGEYNKNSHGTIEMEKGHSYHWIWEDDEIRNDQMQLGTNGMRPLYEVAKKYMYYSRKVDNALQNIKYNMAEMLKVHKTISVHPGFQVIHAAKTMDDVENALEMLKDIPAMNYCGLFKDDLNEETMSRIVDGIISTKYQKHEKKKAMHAGRVRRVDDEGDIDHKDDNEDNKDDNDGDNDEFTYDVTTKWCYKNPHPPNKFQTRPQPGDQPIASSKKHKTELKILQSKQERNFS